ncbi:MAG: IS701 family transposase [Phycisphaerae bacterium]|nr:IS701 family transposase [Phycisphaerae bacterium]
MNAQQIAELGPRLEAFASRFDDSFVRVEQLAHARCYLRGQLSDLQRKNIEAIALAAGTAPRSLQEFLSRHRWREDAARNRVQQIVGREHAHPDSIGIIDETYFAKKGDKTPGVQRQWCGTKGTTDNCAVMVNMGYAAGSFHCLIDAELFLPKVWSDDRQRCDEAGIPEDMVHRTKSEIALELLDRCRGNGVVFNWLVFDAGYGMVKEFLHALNDRGQRFVAEVPEHFFGWVHEPPTMLKEHGGPHLRPGRRYRQRHPGWKRDFPRLKARGRRASSVKNLARHSPIFRDQAYVPFHIKDTLKGPVVWEVKYSKFYYKRGMAATWAHWFLVCRQPLTGEIKYFVSNAPESTPLGIILYIAFSRWHVEKCFQEEKSELGLSHFEVRNYTSMIRHCVLTSMTHLFLAEEHQRLAGDRGE